MFRHRWPIPLRHHAGATTCAPPMAMPPIHRRCDVSGPPMQVRRLSAYVGATAVSPPLACHPCENVGVTTCVTPLTMPPAGHRCVDGYLATVGTAAVAPLLNHCRLALPPLPQPCHRLPPSRHHSCVNWVVILAWLHLSRLSKLRFFKIYSEGVILPACPFWPHLL